MTARQKREILILVIVVIVAAGAGMLYRQLTSGGSPDGTGAPPKPRKTSPTDVVARVDGQEITRSLLDKYYGVTLGLHGLDEETVPETMRHRLMARSLEQIIDERVLASAAASRGVEVTQEEVAQMVEEAKNAFGSEEEFTDNLNNDLGLTVEELKEMLYYQRLAEEVRQTFAEGIEVTEGEIDEQMKNYEAMLKDHPGGDVPLPSREDAKAEAVFGKADRLYTEWLDGVVATANIEILDMSLIEEAQPQMPADHPPMGTPEMPQGHPPTGSPGMPEGHPPVKPPAESGGAGA